MYVCKSIIMIQPSLMMSALYLAVWYVNSNRTADMYVDITGHCMGECDDTAPTIPASHGLSPDPETIIATPNHPQWK